MLGGLGRTNSNVADSVINKYIFAQSTHSACFPQTVMSFNGISHNVRPDQHSDLWGIDALEMNLGETGALQVRPRRSGDPASIHEVVPQTLQHMLEEVGPGGRI